MAEFLNFFFTITSNAITIATTGATRARKYRFSEFIDRAVGDTGSIVNVSVVGTDICVVVCVIVVVAIPVVVVLSVVGVDGSVVIGDVDLVGTVVVGGIGCMCSKKLAINIDNTLK